MVNQVNLNNYVTIFKVENQAGERDGVTECPRLLSHRRATPAVKPFVGSLECKFLGVRNSRQESV